MGYCGLYLAKGKGMEKEVLWGRTLAAPVVVALLACTSTVSATEPSGSRSDSPATGSAAARCNELRSFEWPGLTVEEARVVPPGKVEPPPDTAPSPAPSTVVP